MEEPLRLPCSPIWDTTETLVLVGRLYADRTMRLFLNAVDFSYSGIPDESRAPSTPPSIMEGMRHRARLQDQADAALRHAAETGFSGDGTPPLAFMPQTVMSLISWLGTCTRGRVGAVLGSLTITVPGSLLLGHFRDPPCLRSCPLNFCSGFFAFGDLTGYCFHLH